MKTLYLDCAMGAAGDMLMAALLELHPDPENFLARMNALGLPGVEVTRRESIKCGIRGTHVSVLIHGGEEDDHHHHHEHGHDHHHDHHHHDHGHHHHHDHAHDDHHHDHEHHHEHHHATPGAIGALIAGLDLPEPVKGNAKAVYELIAAAESAVHGVEMEHIHFHEVGTLDAVTDVVGVCLLMHELGAEQIVCSPVHVGSGTVRCAHGILPVPAPATALLLRGVPVYGGEIRGELCTPTGAALLKHFAQTFGPMPPMVPQAYGYGMGTRDFPAANCVRAILGESGGGTDEVVELACNLDDMTGEAVAFACETLLENGALDVWTAPITMKKGRSAVMLSCLAKPERERELTDLMLRHTTTLGVRTHRWQRTVLERRVETVDTPLGAMKRKVAEGQSVSRTKWEYEDLAAAARARGMSLEEVKELLQ